MNDMMLWYATLIKPSWAPPAWLFGPAWTFLYAIIAVSFGYVFYAVLTKRMPLHIALPFVLNLIFNAAFSPIQFLLQNNLLALIDVVLVLITLVWALYAVWPHARAVVYANIPYLSWVSFATVLQATVTFLNW